MLRTILYIWIGICSCCYVSGTGLRKREICKSTQADLDAEIKSPSVAYSGPYLTYILINTEVKHQLNTNKYCFWQIDTSNQTVKISFLEFDLEEDGGYKREFLKLRFSESDGSFLDKDLTYYGTSYPRELKVQAASVIIIFLTDSSRIGSRFSLEVQTDEEACSKTKILDVGHIPSFLYSPGYPFNYFRNLSCTWKLQHQNQDEEIMLEFLEFNINYQCRLDEFRISTLNNTVNRTECGERRRFVVKVPETEALLSFTTGTRQSGFAIKYYSSPAHNSLCRQASFSTIKMTAIRGRSKVITADIQSCLWHITAEHPSDVIVMHMFNPPVTPRTRSIWIVKIQEIINNKTVTTKGASVSYIEYYRSATNNLKLAIYETASYIFFGRANILNISFSFYSIPKDVFTEDITVYSKPAYIYIPALSPSENRDLTLVAKTNNKCILATVLTANRNVRIKKKPTEYFDFIIENSGVRRKLEDVCWIRSDIIGGYSDRMIIQRLMGKHLNVGTWLKIDPSTSCNGVVLHLPITTAREITSPNYPQSYKGNLACTLVVYHQNEKVSMIIDIHTYPGSKQTTAASLTNLTSPTMTIFNNNRYRNVSYQWNLETPERFAFIHNNIHLSLNSVQSNGGVTGAFKLSFSLENIPKAEHCSKTIYLSHNKNDSIQSPYFNEHYVGLIDCMWDIKAPLSYDMIVFTIHRLYFGGGNGCFNSNLDVYDDFEQRNITRYCESISKPITTYYYGRMRVKMVDVALGSSMQGFNASVSVVNAPERCNEIIPVGVTGKYLVVTNRNYQTRSIRKCTYRFTTEDIYSDIRLEFNGYNLGSCDTGRIEIYDGQTASSGNLIAKLCDKQTRNKLTYMAKKSSVLLVFTSSPTSSSTYLQAFKVRYDLRVHKEEFKKQATLRTSSSDKYFQSENYPLPYKRHMKYQWRFYSFSTPIHLEVVESFLGYTDSKGRRDSVRVFQGRTAEASQLLGEFFSHETPSYHCNCTNLVVQLISVVEDSHINKGFRIKYYRTSISRPSVPPLEIIFPSIIVAIILTAIVIRVLCYFYRRKVPRSTTVPSRTHPDITLRNRTQPNITLPSISGHTPQVVPSFGPPPSYAEANTHPESVTSGLSPSYAEANTHPESVTSGLPPSYAEANIYPENVTSDLPPSYDDIKSDPAYAAPTSPPSYGSVCRSVERGSVSTSSEMPRFNDTAL